MRIYFTLILALFSLVVVAQVPQANVLSLHVIGGNSFDGLLSHVTNTSDGGFIVSIETNSTVGSIDSLCGISDPGIVFQKYNADATTLEWSKCYAADGDTGLGYMFPAADGGNVFGGAFADSYNRGFYICKQNASGSIIWSHAFSKGESTVLADMIATSDGGYIMAGLVFFTDTNFTVHHGTSFDADIGVLKLDSLGNKVWATVIGGTGDEGLWCVMAGPGNGCYVVGNTPSNDFDCSGNHGGGSGTHDAYIARLDGNGNLLWHHDLGGTGSDGGDWGYPDGNGGIIMAGSSGSNDGDVTHQVNVGGGNIWVLDLDSSNNILWNNCYGGGGAEFATSVCKATDGSIWIAGQSQIKGGEVDTAYGNTDAWFVHTDNAGNFLDAKVLGSSQEDQGYLVYPLSNGNIIAGGYYEDSDGTFPKIYYGGFGDAFWGIFGPWPERVPQAPQANDALKIYPNPAVEQVTITTQQMDNYLIITDVIGRTIYATNINGKIEIKVDGWQPGMYYVQVTNSYGFRNVQKLIVK